MNVSVLIAATRPTTIAAAVQSIVRQTVADWELIVVAQGRESLQVAEEAAGVAGARGRMRVLEQSGRGLSRARNAALDAARGHIVVLTDDDCEADPDWLAVITDG